MLIPILIAAAIVVFAMMMFMNKKSETQEREGVVKSVLNKDALSVDFGDGNNTVVKFYGLAFPHESEMQDEKIDAFLHENLLGSRLKFKSKHIENGGVVVAAVYSLADEYINAAIARLGLARWTPSEASSDSELMNAQKEAKSTQAGVWNIAVQELMKEKRRQSENSVDSEDGFDSEEDLRSE
jgi:endonuclease YncB( thermonuclease family)